MHKSKMLIFCLISEAALYFFLFYAQWLMFVTENLWISSLILWALLNISIICCPLMMMGYKMKMEKMGKMGMMDKTDKMEKPV